MSVPSAAPLEREDDELFLDWGTATEELEIGIDGVCASGGVSFRMLDRSGGWTGLVG